MTLETADLEYVLTVFPTTWGIVLNPDQPGHDRPVNFARAEQGGMSISGWVPISLIPSGRGRKDTHCDHVLCHSRDNPVSIV